MEFGEKLKELRKAKGLTQDELAECLFVSRTAVSKWESGRGYPSIDSLKQIALFFSVSIDELICSENAIILAEKEKQESIHRNVSLICCAADAFAILLLFLPIFGASAETVFSLTGTALWEKCIFFTIICITALNGICGLILLRFDKPRWNQHRIVTGIALSIIGTMIFIAARQPYAAVMCFSLLLVKSFLIFKER